MNVGELRDRISVQAFRQTGNIYAWETDANIWAKAEMLRENNIFSKVGIGAKSIKFKIRKRNGLTLHNAFKWKGKHCFLTNIVDDERMYYEVTAALVEPVICTIERTSAPTKNELNRPVYATPEEITFPAIITEKYVGHMQERPMAITEVTYVLVTPKVIELATGEIVNVNSKAFTVLIPHTLDEYKNEYEIMVKEDA